MYDVEIEDVEIDIDYMVTGGRRHMAIYGEEMYCGREHSCIFNEELESLIVGPLRFFHECLDMNTWETYEISTYFPLDGEQMGEGYKHINECTHTYIRHVYMCTVFWLGRRFL